MGIQDRVAVITGATGGLGRVVARVLADAGARLALVGSNAERLAELAGSLGLTDRQWLTVTADLSRPDAAGRVLEAVVAKYGRAELLLHFVGGWSGGKEVAQVAAEDVAAMLQQHVWTSFYLAKVFGPHFVANGWGRVVIVSSPSAAAPPAKGLPYAVAKAGQEALMLTLAEELKGSGVTANVLRVKTIDINHERDRAPNAKNAAWTTPEEIAAAVLYLCSDAAGTVNGARIPLYGSP